MMHPSHQDPSLRSARTILAARRKASTKEALYEHEWDPEDWPMDSGGVPLKDTAYWTAVPTTERQRVQAHGLVAADPTHNWAAPEDWARVHDKPGFRPPTGVYAFQSLPQAHDYAWKLFHHRGVAHDVYRIDPQHVQETQPDPDNPSAVVIPHDVPAQLAVNAETMHQDAHQNAHDDEDWRFDSENDTGLPWKEIPKEYGVGMPNHVWGSANEHALWWKPGEVGRGFIEPTGRVHTWPESEGTHESMAFGKGIPWEDVRRSSFLTRPDGQTRFPYGAALVNRPPDEEAAWINQVQAADPRLKGVPYYPAKGIAQAYGKTADLYHVAPTTERNRIQQHGLQPSQPMNNEFWGDQDFWQYRHPNLDVPEGVYGWPKPGQAYDYAGRMETAKDTPMDVWRFPHEGLQDPDISSAQYVPHPVMDPQLHEGPEHRTWDALSRMPYEQMWNNYKPLGLNQDKNPDYERLWDRRVGGWPVKSAEWRIPQPYPEEKSKLHDFLMNPKNRPDLQTPEAQEFLGDMERNYHNDKTDALMPWLTREWKKGRLDHSRNSGGVRWPGDDPAGYFDPRDVSRWPTLGPSRVNHWADFLRSNHPVRRGLGDIMQHDVSSFHNQVSAWDKAMEEEAAAKQHEEAARDGTIVHTTPDGYTIRQLREPEELTREGDAMGHCVGSYADDVQNGKSLIYSLRDPQGLPHATTEIAPTHYTSGEDGRMTNEEYGGDGGMEQNFSIPHRGEVVQIQGKANKDPKPEYKQQLAHWFNTFSPEDRPQWSNSAWDRDENIADVNDIDDRHMMPPGSYDEYGLKPAKPDFNWEKIVDSVLPYDQDYYHFSDGHKAYEAAKAHGQIPELAHEVQRFGDKQQSSLDNWMDQNYQIAPRYSDPGDPHGWEDKYGNEVGEGEGRPYWTPRGSGDGYGGNEDRSYSPDEVEKEYDDAMNEWTSEHPGMQAANHLHTLVAPHYNYTTQAYENTPPTPTPTSSPETFS